MTTEPWTLNDGTVVPMQGNSIDPETWRGQTCETCAWIGSTRIDLRNPEGGAIVGHAGYCRRACFGGFDVWTGDAAADLRIGMVRLDSPACPAWVAR